MRAKANWPIASRSIQLRSKGNRPYALIVGGGTGGHVNPALAIADAIVARGHERGSIAFVGSKRGLESRLVPEAGYRITLLPGRGIERKVSKASIEAVLSLIVALAQALVLVARQRPQVVVSVGGYAAAPCAIAAGLLRVPLVLAEANAVPGAVNRLVGRMAKASAVAMPNTGLPREVVTGSPVRPEIARVDRSGSARNAARQKLELPEHRVVVGVFGGSLGARSINRAVVELADKWRHRGDVAIRHVVGSRDWANESLRYKPGADDQLVYQAVEYENQMAVFYEAGDVFVTRSGSTTVAEMTATGSPAVFVPLPNAPGDHQTANARTLESAGAAVLLPDGEVTAERLDDILTPLIADAVRRNEMGAAAKAFAVPDAADRVAALVERHAKER